MCCHLLGVLCLGLVRKSTTKSEKTQYVDFTLWSIVLCRNSLVSAFHRTTGIKTSICLATLKLSFGECSVHFRLRDIAQRTLSTNGRSSTVPWITNNALEELLWNDHVQGQARILCDNTQTTEAILEYEHAHTSKTNEYNNVSKLAVYIVYTGWWMSKVRSGRRQMMQTSRTALTHLKVNQIRRRASTIA